MSTGDGFLVVHESWCATLGHKPTGISRHLAIVTLMTEPSPADEITRPDPLLHAFQNHLSAIVGFCDLLLRELPEGDPKRADILEMHKAGHAAIDLLPKLSIRIR